MGYTNSSLVNFTKISPNKSNTRKAITGICIHCMAGNLTVQSCGNLFAKSSTQASSNYGVDSKGNIGLYVPESMRSWCTCTQTIDGYMVTIEVANDGGAPNWHVNNTALRSLLLLCADICKRNNIRLRWDKNKVATADATFNKTKNRKTAYSSLYVASDTHNMPLHRWVSAKACPGNYLVSLMPWICENTNKLLDGVDINSIIFPNGKTTTGTTSTSNTTTNTKSNTTSSTTNKTISLVYGGVDMTPVFNAAFYSNKYADLKAAFGTDEKKLFDHFCNNGMKEARQGCATFDPVIYRKNYPDLDKAYGDNWVKYYQHYLLTGIKEGRKGV